MRRIYLIKGLPMIVLDVFVFRVVMVSDGGRLRVFYTYELLNTSQRSPAPML